MTQFELLLAGRRHQISQVNDDDKQILIEQLSKFIEEQARIRFQQQINQHHPKHVIPQEITGPGFSFVLPTMTKAEFNKDSDEPIEFAVQPFDSRYYQNSDTDADDDDVEENTNVLNEEIRKNQMLIPPPMHVHDSDKVADKILHRAQLKQQQKIQQAQDVMQKPLQVEFDNTTSLYIVALIAGLSCAFSTGVSCCAICQLTSIDFLFFSS